MSEAYVLGSIETRRRQLEADTAAGRDVTQEVDHFHRNVAMVMGTYQTPQSSDPACSLE